jgi:uncharacterized protein YcfJ
MNNTRDNWTTQKRIIFGATIFGAVFGAKMGDQLAAGMGGKLIEWIGALVGATVLALMCSALASLAVLRIKRPND